MDIWGISLLSLSKQQKNKHEQNHDPIKNQIAKPRQTPLQMTRSEEYSNAPNTPNVNEVQLYSTNPCLSNDYRPMKCDTCCAKETNVSTLILVFLKEPSQSFYDATAQMENDTSNGQGKTRNRISLFRRPNSHTKLTPKTESDHADWEIENKRPNNTHANTNAFKTRLLAL